MMSSVDLSTSGRGPHAAAPQSAAANARYSAQHMRYAAPPPRASGSSTGRAKTEQVVLEFLYKAAELIAQSRVNFQAEPDPRRGGRRARFNLDIEEVQAVREAMAAWKEDVRLPLAVDVFWDAGDGRKLLLERWSVTFAADGEGSGAHLGSTQDVIQQLKEVCKRISVLLRALFSFMRQLPAHRLFAQSYPSMLSYSMHAAPASDAARAFGAQRAATSGYSFIPIATPFGLLKVAAVYRRDCDQFTERQEQAAPSRIFQDNFIIQDYVPGSPELVPASAPVPSRATAAMADAPVRVTDLRTDSFVPVSDAEQFGGNVGALQRRRSSPRSIPTSGTTPQQFSSTGPVGDRGDDDDVGVRPQPGLSKPMAIPRVSSKGGMATAGGREAAAATGYGDEQNDGKIIQHAHSYGGEHDVRLRGAAANPNVTAAPYGYGNVAIDREQQHTSSPSLAFQQRQQQLWEGGANHQNAESILHGSQTSFHDEPPTSNSNVAYHHLSTPPRHPKSISLLRSGRTSPALTHKPFLSGNETQHAPGSLDNFTLDSGSPSPLQQHVPRRRKSSFNGAFVSDSSIGSSNAAFSGAAGVQENLQTKGSAITAEATTKSEAITIRQGGAKPPPADGIPMFSSSPPFQANPCELLSTSPGYSYSKNYLRSGSSNVPTFITTDQFQLGLHGAKRSSFSSAGLISAKKRGFSPDFSDSGVTAWGISPDTPDAFGLAIIDAGGNSSGGRPRFLSLSGSVEAGGASSDGQSDDLDDDGTDMILPFAIGESSSIGSSTTTAADSVSTGAGSALNRSTGASLDTASVGSFLHQIKNAPRLSKSASTLNPPAGESDNTSDDKQVASVPSSTFDDELAGFRSLRDELARVL
ncbi:Phosphoprotein involved in cytoplasm to vacuole targeting and autophagy [Phytophthora cinnamomi]|uniref:Phosphoprotein involved in cytoplasm to vacuole targeting and autophagy n=1 Tax=Phytophthora cinnamomi TaxID=4785 RepID=UPI003559F070|nr:Phosphoprotein involved in cytoplasm to vacuole targeting and autophagy [Phytophthora cinnamomi]